MTAAAALSDIGSEQAQSVSVRIGAVRLSKRYGAVQANREITLSVSPGEIHAIVGENGAGKSTLMRMLQGIEQPDSGEIIVDDREVSFSSAQQAFEIGIGMVHQEFMLAPELTLLENLILGAEPVTRPLGMLSRLDWRSAIESGNKIASMTGVDIDWHRAAGGCPVHIQQFTEIIRLLRRGTRILILDEPTSVLAPRQVNDLFKLLRGLRDQGTTIVFISHKLREVMDLADFVTVLRGGEVRHSSKICATDMASIARHIIGEDPAGQPLIQNRKRRKESAEVLFEVTGLSSPSVAKSYPLDGVAFNIRRGEIVGLAGVSGNGQSELVECLVGLRPVSEGVIRYAGEDITNMPTGDRRSLGIGYVSSDRRQEGLAHHATIEVNVIAGSQRTAPICRNRLIDRRAMRNAARQRLGALSVLYDQLADAVSNLSGGNQQRLVFAREIAPNPGLLIVSQPTRGVDLKGIDAIHQLLGDYRDNGGSAFLVSEELSELLLISDRICVLAHGRIVGELDSEAADVAKLGELMLMRGRRHD